MTRILVSIPAFNEEKTIERVITTVLSIPALCEATVLVVDDGSIDETAAMSRAAGAVVLSHPRNLGVGRAFSSSVDFALRNSFDVMITVDADNQFPREAVALVAESGLTTGAFTSGSRFLDKIGSAQVPKIKRIGNLFLASVVSYLSDRKLTDISCGLRLYPREALRFIQLRGKFTYTQESLLDIASRGLEMREVPIPVQYFKGRKSAISSNLLAYALRAGAIIWASAKTYFPAKVFLPLAAITGSLGSMLSLLFLTNFVATGKFSGFLFAGFLGGFFLALCLIFVAVSLISTSLSELRLQIAFATNREPNAQGYRPDTRGD